MEYLPQSYLSLPENPGVYRFHSETGEILYVGKAKNLKARVSSYFTSSLALGEKTRILVSQIYKISITYVESEFEALLLEAYYIKKYRPKYNIRLTDDKTYPLIKITIKSEYPAVLYARRMNDTKALYFGPYPNPGDVRRVLRVIRRIFPFQSVPNHPKRVCLYHHLGLCPCLPVFDTREQRTEYKKNLRRIVKILDGKSRELEKELEKERDAYAKNEEFEKAGVIQHQIQALEAITNPHYKPFEYDTNPNLREDLREGELRGLQEALHTHGLNVDHLDRIECYDISNTQGTHATGSMVVFADGEKDGENYRRFKMRKDGSPNDFAMMEEMLTRRLKHTEWDSPSLIIVDGGKGQVTAALRAFAKSGKSYPLIGLAKREETIIIPLQGVSLHKDTPFQKKYENRDQQFVELKLPKDAPSLHLIQRIRDEAHRFAIKYHRKMRNKAFLS